MISRVLLVACPGRGPRIHATGAVAARRTGPDTVHLVSAAATPLGGDSLSVRVVVEPGARLRLRSAAAAIALPGPASTESSAEWELEVAGELDLDAAPTIVAGTARHGTRTRIFLSAEARLRHRERVQIGRAGERADASRGFFSSAVHADASGQPLLRHRVEMGADGATFDPIGMPLATISELRYPDAEFDAPGTLLALAGGGALATWQGARL